MAQPDGPTARSAHPDIRCPWCPYTAEVLKRVLTHMEAAHPQRWRDLALHPPIAGTVG